MSTYRGSSTASGGVVDPLATPLGCRSRRSEVSSRQSISPTSLGWTQDAPRASSRGPGRRTGCSPVRGGRVGQWPRPRGRLRGGHRRRGRHRRASWLPRRESSHARKSSTACAPGNSFPCLYKDLFAISAGLISGHKICSPLDEPTPPPGAPAEACLYGNKINRTS